LPLVIMVDKKEPGKGKRKAKKEYYRNKKKSKK